MVQEIGNFLDTNEFISIILGYDAVIICQGSRHK